MYIERVSLQQFRNYEKLTLALNQGVNVLYGANAQGKTNFLESVYFCATGRSKRTGTDRELILLDRGEAHIQLSLNRAGLRDRLDVHIKRDARKGIAVNGIAVKKLSDLFGVLYAVAFSPEDLQLIKAGPAERRRFMDLEICQLSGVYYFNLQQYYKILKQRNHLLKEIQRKKAQRDTLQGWDEQLAGYGTKVMAQRRVFLERINGIARALHGGITDEHERLTILYKPGVPDGDFLARMRKNLDRDLATGMTNAGIHKDDIVFLINDLDARVYGSQGQQRTAALSVKLSEIELIRQEKATSPVLLLDDVLSELDQHRQTCLIRHMKDLQTIITATGLEDIINKIEKLENISVFCVTNGGITLTNA